MMAASSRKVLFIYYKNYVVNDQTDCVAVVSMCLASFEMWPVSMTTVEYYNICIIYLYI